MTQKEKLELYYRAKEAYYNGQEIMTDFEFDQLEKELGLENKSEVGTKHNPSYTIRHPFIMGSLAKVQIHKDKDGTIDWRKYSSQVANYIDMENSFHVIITPKYDGCSFECEIENNKIQSISSRGDGTWGKDLMNHLINFIPSEYVHFGGHYTLRGEVLVKKSVFEQKYAEKFTNPRSFVSGVLNRDYNGLDNEFMEMLNDLSIVIYDYRTEHYGTWCEHEWTELPQTQDVLPTFYSNDVSIYEQDALEKVYNAYADYRKTCEYALDGIVIKPIVRWRRNNLTEHRPKDCVAIKFIPMLEETEVLNITWQLGKTHEYTPIIWVKPVEMDGRMVQKCSGHNIGYLRQKGITIGAKIIMSLAGDIIPFMYKVTHENPNGEIPMPTDHEYYEDDIHLMAILSEEEKNMYKFLNSVKSLGIPTIGPSAALDILKYITFTGDTETMEFFGEEKKETPNNILLISPEDVFFGVGGGKSGDNAKKAFSQILDNLTLNDIVKSCNFKFCGGKVAEQVVNYLLNGDADFTHLATEGYSWVFNKNSEQYQEVMHILEHLGKNVDDFKVKHEETKKIQSDQIPVILTGEPNNYKSKGEFLKLNPQYRNTGSWKEVQIVFTNSFESNTGKMKKAREKGIKIELY